MKRILISRFRDWRCRKIQETIKDEFEVITIDHEPSYLYGNDFKMSYRYKTAGSLFWKAQIKNIIEDHKITHAIIAQKLNDMAEATYEVCKEMGVKCIWGEVFFDDKLILDYNGLQYTPDNDIMRYADSWKGKEIDLPKTTRQPQPEGILSYAQLQEKYSLKGNEIVIIGQVPHDMALKHSLLGELNYDEFIKNVAENNPENEIIFKPHPQSNAYEMGLHRYKNIKIVKESLETYFNCFDDYVMFSSTVGLEALIRNKKVAVCGYGMVTNDKLSVLIKSLEDFKDIKNKLRQFKICEETKTRWLSFLTTRYAVDMNKPEFTHKLLLIAEEYYANGI